MCRLAAYVGKVPSPLSSVLYDPPHSLEQASHSPRELLDGSVNVDGTGVAWWEPGDPDPMRYVTTQPPWSDPNLAGLSRRLHGDTILAAVRSATPGIPFGPSNVAPFIAGEMAGVHNGWIGGFRQGVGRALVESLSDSRFGQLDVMNDSLALFLLVAQAVDDQPGLPVPDAVTVVLERVAKEVIAAGERATLNLVVATPRQIVATRTSAGYAVNSLYLRHSDEGVWLASEALDESDGWRAVPEHSLAILSPDHVTITSLAHDGISE